MIKTVKKAISVFLALVIMLPAFTGCSPSVSARVTVEGTKFMVNGSEIWFNAVNTPWYSWNDFTGNMDEEVWEQTFAQLAEDNINCTRIWINCNGMDIVTLTDSGKIVQIREEHWTDLDKLFALAEKYGVYVMATLLSFDHFKNTRWQTLISTQEMADAYAEQYVKEFCTRYADCEYLFAIDIMNEPDWVYENEECGQIDWDKLSYFFGKCADVIHENSDILVTVGLGMIKYNSDRYEGNMVSDEYLQELTGLDGAYLDFYSTHYYEWQRNYFGYPCDQSPEDFGLDGTKPCVIGETSNDDESQIGVTLSEKYKSVYDNGWNGIFVWMEPQTDDEQLWYEYGLTQAATNSMAEYIYDKIYPIGKK